MDEELERALRRGQRERLLTGVTLARTSLRGDPVWRALDPDQKKELREQLMRGDAGAAVLTLSVPNPWQALAEDVAEEKDEFDVILEGIGTPPPGITTGAATAVTLNFSLNASTNSESSSTVIPPMVSRSSS